MQLQPISYLASLFTPALLQYTPVLNLAVFTASGRAVCNHAAYDPVSASHSSKGTGRCLVCECLGRYYVSVSALYHSRILISYGRAAFLESGLLLLFQCSPISLTWLRAF
jgi:hypothetical protein